MKFAKSIIYTEKTLTDQPEVLDAEGKSLVSGARLYMNHPYHRRITECIWAEPLIKSILKDNDFGDITVYDSSATYVKDINNGCRYLTSYTGLWYDKLSLMADNIRSCSESLTELTHQFHLEMIKRRNS